MVWLLPAVESVPHTLLKIFSLMIFAMSVDVMRLFVLFGFLCLLVSLLISSLTVYVSSSVNWFLLSLPIFLFPLSQSVFVCLHDIISENYKPFLLFHYPSANFVYCILHWTDSLHNNILQFIMVYPHGFCLEGLI